MNGLRLLGLSFVLVMLCALPPLVWAQADPTTLDYRLQAQPLAEGVYVVPGANADFSPANGCHIINTGFVVTGAGVVVINTGPSRRFGEQLRALIERTTREPILRVVHLNLHPDYFLGNQAFADVPRLATARTRAGMQREAKAYEDNLYRLCGAWMKGTEALLPDAELKPGRERIGQVELEWTALAGHTDSDLLLRVRTAGGDVLFAGGLVFNRRVPTMPHAKLPAWQASLRALAGMAPPRHVVPSHGELAGDGIGMTLRYIAWLDRQLREAADQGLELNEVLRLPAPAEFRGWAAYESESLRNIVRLYPAYEQAALKAR